jgi:hypothetical protein
VHAQVQAQSQKDRSLPGAHGADAHSKRMAYILRTQIVYEGEKAENADVVKCTIVHSTEFLFLQAASNGALSAWRPTRHVLYIVQALGPDLGRPTPPSVREPAAMS